MASATLRNPQAARPTPRSAPLPLSLRESWGEGKLGAVLPTGPTIPGTVRLRESSGKARGLPVVSNVEMCPHCV
jgi:hypothetical protein